MTPLSETNAGGPPTFLSGGNSRPRWSRSSARAPELRVLAEDSLPVRRGGFGCQPEPGQTGSGTCALPGLAGRTPAPRVPEERSSSYLPPATSRQLVSGRLKVEKTAFRVRRSSPPLSDPRNNGFSDRSTLCQSTLSPPRPSRRTLHWLHQYRPTIRFSSWIG